MPTMTDDAKPLSLAEMYRRGQAQVVWTCNGCRANIATTLEGDTFVPVKHECPSPSPILAMSASWVEY